MGFLGDLFGGKEETTTQNVNDVISVSKIVKLSYLQSLAYNSRVANVKDLIDTSSKSRNITSSDVDENFATELSNWVTDGGWVDKILKGPLKEWGDRLDFIFGGSSTTDVNLTVKDSGWSVVKSWREPQFDIIRYAIGIRDLTFTQFTYKQVSEIVSVPWQSPKDIQKVYLVVDQFIPPEFPPGTYIEYYVKPEIDKQTWTRINPVGLPTQYLPSGAIIPRIISYNTEKPVNSNLEHAYLTTSEEVKSMRVRIVLKRPTASSSGIDPASYTPIVRSYRLFMSPRGGL